MKFSKFALIAVLALSAASASSVALAEPVATRTYTEAGGALIKVNDRGLVAVINVDTKIYQADGGALLVSKATVNQPVGTGQISSN
jgi:hypothetical protein